MHTHSDAYCCDIQDRSWIDQAFAGSSATNRTSYPLRKNNNSFGIFYLNIFLETKPTQYQAKVKKEKDQTAHDGKSDTKTERMMFR